MTSILPNPVVHVEVTTPTPQTVAVASSPQTNVDISAGGASFNQNPQAIISTEIAGTALLALRVCVFNAQNRLIYANASDRSHANRIAGLTIAAAAQGGSVRLLRQGLWTSDSWNWQDAVILLGENGILTNEMPTVGGFYIQIAQRQTATSIFFNPAQPILIDA
jgi:hypothetical protein